MALQMEIWTKSKIMNPKSSRILLYGCGILRHLGAENKELTGKTHRPKGYSECRYYFREVTMKAGIIGLVLFVVTALSSVFADVIIIPDDYSTIQAGVDASQDGDTVIVQPGVYHENLLIEGHSLILASRFFATRDTLDIYNTVIDGDSLDTVVRLGDWNDPGSILLGFTITNGASGYHGGGVYVENSSVISNNIIENNITSRGGGIHVVGNAIISDNIIRNNHVTVAGGGIITYGGSFIIQRNIIQDNVSDYYGGAYFPFEQVIICPRNVARPVNKRFHLR